MSCQNQDYIVDINRFNNLDIETRTHKDSLNITHFKVKDEHDNLVKIYTTINGLKEGKEVKYFKNGNREYEGTFVQDTLNGEVKFFYNNKLNSIESIHNYETGTLVGVQQKYYPNGKIQYYIGQLYNGDIAYKLEYSEEGKILKEEGRFKILGAFGEVDFSSEKKIDYTAHIATPPNTRVIYKYSINLIDEPKKWKTLPIYKSKVSLDTLINKKGEYLFSEVITIYSESKPEESVETYNVTFKIK